MTALDALTHPCEPSVRQNGQVSPMQTHAHIALSRTAAFCVVSKPQRLTARAVVPPTASRAVSGVVACLSASDVSCAAQTVRGVAISAGGTLAPWSAISSS